MPVVLPSAPGGILALDLSSVVGWAYGPPTSSHPFSGTWRLRGDCLGGRLVAFENELIRALGARVPRLVIMEAPLPSTAQRSNVAARQAFGLAAYVESECYRAGIELREGQVGQVRKAVLGKGSFGDTDKNKAAVMSWCLAQGWHPTDHNAGDALVLWRYACMVWAKKTSPLR